MSNQLFLQAFATWELIIRTIREGTLYFVQRQPEELADIRLIVDRKDRTVTQMEETWSTLILPVSEDAFAREPLVCLAGEDYSYFEARYGFTAAPADPEMLRHSRWVSSVYGESRKGRDAVGIDAKRLLTEQLIFDNSRDSLGLQLADMLASALRRALNNRLQFPGWKEFGGLLIRHQEPGTEFIQLGSGSDTPMRGHAMKVCQILHATAKNRIAVR